MKKEEKTEWQQIKNYGNVAVAIDHDCSGWDDLKKLKIKGTGTATLIEGPEEMQKAFGLLVQKFLFLKTCRESLQILWE